MKKRAVMDRKNELEALRILEMHTERYGAQFKAIIRLNNGEEREAIGDTASDAQQQAMSGLELDWSFSKSTM